MKTFNEPPEYAQARRYASERRAARKLTQVAKDTGQHYEQIRSLAIGRTNRPNYELVKALLADEKRNKRANSLLISSK